MPFFCQGADMVAVLVWRLSSRVLGLPAYPSIHACTTRLFVGRGNACDAPGQLSQQALSRKVVMAPHFRSRGILN